MQHHILVAVGTDGSHAALALGIARAPKSMRASRRFTWWTARRSGRYRPRSTTSARRSRRSTNSRAKSKAHATGDTRVSINGVCVTIDLPGGTTLARVIAQAAREFDADLIVTGRTKATHWRFWEERIADAVSRYSNRRVLIASESRGP